MNLTRIRISTRTRDKVSESINSTVLGYYDRLSGNRFSTATGNACAPPIMTRCLGRR